MSTDPWQDVRDAVAPAAKAGELTDRRAEQIAAQHRCDIGDVGRIFGEERQAHLDALATQLEERVTAAVNKFAEKHAGDVETAEPDSDVQASAPPAVEQPAPPADIQWPTETVTVDAPCMSGLMDHGAHMCSAPKGHDGLHVCDGKHQYPGECNLAWDDPADFYAPRELELPADVEGIAPLTDAEQLMAGDVSLLSNAVLALSMLMDHEWPDQIRAQLDQVITGVEGLHRMVRDHHRAADLVAERAVLAARLAEIDTALDDIAQTPDPQSVMCECGEYVKPIGIGTHRARSKTHRAWAENRGAA
jgi:hypothetical protein